MLGDIYTYFRDKMDSLDYDEHEEAFDFENIPENMIDGSYFLDVSPSSGEVQDADQDAQKTTNNVVIRVFKNGYNRVQDAKKEALDNASVIIATMLLAQNKLDNSEGILNISLVSFSIEPLSDSNDHSLVLELSFAAEAYIDFYEVLGL